MIPAPRHPLLLAAALGAAPLAAQPAAPDTAPVPRALATALLGWRGGGGARIVVGQFPDGFPREILPPDAVVLGGLASAGGRTAVVALPPGVGEFADWADSLAARAGWRHPPSFRELDAMRGGFVADEPRARPTHYCRGDETLAIVPASGGERGGRLAALSYQRGVPRPACDDAAVAEQRRRMALMQDEMPLPTLRLPRGVVITSGGGGGGSSDARTTRARVVASGTPAELLDPLARQLRDLGWALSAPLAHRTSAMVAGDRRGDDGVGVTVLLTITTVPDGGERELFLQVARGSRQP